MEIALAKGKQAHDKRHAEKEREWQRDKQRIMRAQHPTHDTEQVSKQSKYEISLNINEAKNKSHHLTHCNNGHIHREVKFIFLNPSANQKKSHIMWL